ncbi:anti-repressor SinI family protein [Halobacillus massiliensis]|nr:anti-repressor SinI family protein [Halobacillus massiliensis]
MKAWSRRDSLDTDWMEMMKEAKELGLTLEEVRKFLTDTIKRSKQDIS